MEVLNLDNYYIEVLDLNVINVLILKYWSTRYLCNGHSYVLFCPVSRVGFLAMNLEMLSNNFTPYELTNFRMLKMQFNY